MAVLKGACLDLRLVWWGFVRGCHAATPAIFCTCTILGFGSAHAKGG